MIQALRKYLIPTKENDYKPHLVRKMSLAIISTVAIGIFAAGVFQNFFVINSSFLSAVLPSVLVEFANQDRAKDQLPLLVMNDQLTEAAQAKADDMAARGYFAHNTPEGKTPWYWFSKVGYKFSSAGENLAMNFTDSREVNTAWMNSPAHRENIMNGKFTEIGIATSQGYYQGQLTIFVVQEFGKPYNGPTVKKVVSPKVKVATLAVKTATGTPATSTPSTTPTTVLGAEVTQPIIIVETPTFIAFDNAQVDTATVDSYGESINTEVQSVSPFMKMLTQPRKVVSIAFEILLSIIIIALALTIGVEWKHQHPRTVFASTVVLIFVVILFYLYMSHVGQLVIA